MMPAAQLKAPAPIAHNPLERVQTAVETHPLSQANQGLQRLKNSAIRGAAVLEISPVPS
jgi:hypothetical protein